MGSELEVDQLRRNLAVKADLIDKIARASAFHQLARGEENLPDYVGRLLREREQLRGYCAHVHVLTAVDADGRVVEQLVFAAGEPTDIEELRLRRAYGAERVCLACRGVEGATGAREQGAARASALEADHDLMLDQAAEVCAALGLDPLATHGQVMARLQGLADREQRLVRAAKEVLTEQAHLDGAAGFISSGSDEVRELRAAVLAYEPLRPKARGTMCLVRPEFHECPTCAAKPGSPDLCRECLERRALYSLLKPEMVCPVCRGGMDCECPEHGR